MAEHNVWLRLPDGVDAAEVDEHSEKLSKLGNLIDQIAANCMRDGLPLEGVASLFDAIATELWITREISREDFLAYKAKLWDERTDAVHRSLDDNEKETN